MNNLEEQAVSCPYCGELIMVLVNAEETGQRYIEDCQVCCRPIIFSISVGSNGELIVSVHDENEAF